MHSSHKVQLSVSWLARRKKLLGIKVPNFYLRIKCSSLVLQCEQQQYLKVKNFVFASLVLGWICCYTRYKVSPHKLHQHNLILLIRFWFLSNFTPPFYNIAGFHADLLIMVAEWFSCLRLFEHMKYQVQHIPLLIWKQPNFAEGAAKSSIL